ncbi:MAG: hypothetical protein IJV06_02805 [Bacteroidaceae bacterium]|nr:hypothetical protein [Bacteroidaceae bacterium]
MKIFTLKTLLMSALLCVGLNSWAADETITFSDKYSSNTTMTEETVTGSNFVITFSKGSSGTAPQFYTNGSAIRAYGGNTFTVSSTTNIEKIEIAFGSSDGSNEITTDVGTYESGTWTGSATSVTFTIGGTSGNRRLASIAVTYASSDIPVTQTDPTILVEDDNVTYGTTYTVDDDLIEGGAITVTSADESIATVEGLTITPQAVGTVTITVATAENLNYYAGSKTFTLTVKAPEGSDKAPAAATTLFNETFDESNGSGGRDNTFGGNVGTSSLTGKLDETWTTIGNNGASECIKLGTSSAAGTVKTGNISLTGNGTLTFAAAGWSSGTNTVTVTATGATLSGDTEVTLTNSTWNSYTVNITEATGNVQITFSMKRGFLDDVKVESVGGAANVTAPLNASGYATFCSQYPLDLDNMENGTAWIVKSVADDGAIKFEQATGTVKGGTPLFLMGDAGATVTIPSVDSNVTPAGNLLVGTLAPTYVSDGYGLSGNTFMTINAGVVPAGKAYLPTGVMASGAKPRFVFGEEDATGIQTVKTGGQLDGIIYNLRGQRVANPVKGIYIQNGKKILVK